MDVVFDFWVIILNRLNGLTIAIQVMTSMIVRIKSLALPETEGQ